MNMWTSEWTLREKTCTYWSLRTAEGCEVVYSLSETHLKGGRLFQISMERRTTLCMTDMILRTSGVFCGSSCDPRQRRILDHEKWSSDHRVPRILVLISTTACSRFMTTSGFCHKNIWTPTHGRAADRRTTVLRIVRIWSSLSSHCRLLASLWPSICWTSFCCKVWSRTIVL